MIFHLAREENAWPPQEFLKSWGAVLAPVFRTGFHHELADQNELPVGTYIFSDLELAIPTQISLLTQIWSQLAADGRSMLLNNPAMAKNRYDLLKSLHREGINPYRTFRIDELPSDLRFPVFIRIEQDHAGSRTPLLERWDDLEPWVVKAALGGIEPEALLVTEFFDTRGADGLYRKFGAFKVGGRVIARLVHFGRDWSVKSPDLIFPDGVEEERRFMEANPYEDQIRRAFELAAIDYGRMDFAVHDGRIVVWEINTNPIITHPKERYKPAHLPAQERFAAQMIPALCEIDTAASGSVPIQLRLDAFRRPGQNVS